MEKFELSVWKDEYQTKPDFSTLLAGVSGSEGIRILSQYDNVEKVTLQEQLLDNNEYILLDDNEKGENWHWQSAYYTHKSLKGFINQFERSNDYSINSKEYCQALRQFIDKTGRTDTGKRLFPGLYTEPIGTINPENRYSYYFINTEGLKCITDSVDDGEIWRVKNKNNESKVLILANENMDLFQGRIYNIHFISNINGEKKVTFEVPRYYKDLLTNENKDNEYLDYLKLKTKLKLHFRDKWYTFLINSKEEKKNRQGVYYSFEADDIAKEELARNGYTLTFTEDPETIELCGAGTAAELTERILLNSGWKFNREATTANMQEYQEQVVYDPLKGKYTNKKIPVVSYKKHYSPFLKRYVNYTNFCAAWLSGNSFANEKEFSDYIKFVNSDNFYIGNKGWNIYCYDKSDVVATGSTPNLIASNSQFVNLDDWDTIDDNYGYGIIKVNNDYCLQLSAGGQTSTKNFVKTISKGDYLIKINSTKDNEQYRISFNNNRKELIPLSQNLDCGKYYVFNLSSSLGTSGEFIIKSDKGITIKDITLIKLEVTDNTTGDSVIINYEQHKDIINGIISNSPQLFKEENLKNYNLTLILPDTLISANSKISRTYFIEPYSSVQDAREVLNKETIEDSEEWIIEIPREKVNDYLKNIAQQQYRGYEIKELNNLDNLLSSNIKDSPQNKNIYYLTDKYLNFTIFAPKEFIYDNNKNNEWIDLGLLATSEKTRIITGDKSNRYTLLQNVAEKFKVYVNFELIHNPVTGKIVYSQGQPIKYVYYTDRVGRLISNGIIDTVNLDNISRRTDSSELVTKMYVESLEKDTTEDGLITIQLADKNPSKENYIYNFKHYLNTNQLGENFKQNLDKHNASLKAINEKYLNLTEEFTKIKEQLSSQSSYVYTLEQSKIAAENKKQELLNEITYRFDGTYECINDDKYINSTEFSTRYNYNQRPIPSGTMNKQLNYIFKASTEENYINDERCFLVGDYDWIDKDTDDVIRHLGESTGIIYSQFFNKVFNYLNSQKDNTGFVPKDSFYYDSDTQQIYYYYNYKYNDRESLRIKYCQYYFYLRETDFNKEFNNKSVWRFTNKDNMTFAPRFLTESKANTKINAYNLILQEIEELTNKIAAAKVEQEKIEKQYKILAEDINDLSKAKSSLVNNFENKYIQFIKEGTWSDSNYSDNNTYYLDALCVSNESSLPKVEYSFSIVDLSSIKGYEDYIFEVGDEVFVIDKDLFGVNSTGKPNEEVIIITELDCQLDQNSNNRISLRNYTNRFEDLFSAITASVTSVQSNSETWDRASILNADGTISSSLLTTINTNNNSLASSSIGLLNSYTLDEKGLVLISQLDTNHQLKVTSVGIFITETANKNGYWTLGISASGINASAINSGNLNTNKISIISDYSPSQIWDSLGLSMYSAAGVDGNVTIDNDNFVRVDKHGIYLIDGKKTDKKFNLDSNGKPWYYGRAYEDSLKDIQDNAIISISRDGFRYNSNPNQKNSLGLPISSIQIGKISDTQDGIRCINDNGDVYFSAISDGKSNNAQISSFSFSDTKMWYQKSNVSDIYKAYTTNNSFVIEPARGLSMKNIKLLTSGEAYFGNVHLTGGEITSEGNNPVVIKKTMLGPFRFDATNNKNKYMYGKANGTSIVTNWNSLDMGNKTISQIVKTNNDFYLGTATLTKTDLSNTMSSFSRDAMSDLGSDRAGVLLSLGNNFWIHSGGFGVISGNILMDGNVSIKKLSVEQFDVNGINFTELLRKHGYEVIRTVNRELEYGNNERIAVGGGSGSAMSLQTCDLNEEVAYVNSITGVNPYPKNFYGMPAIKFSRGRSKPGYIVMESLEEYNFVQLYAITYFSGKYYYKALMTAD